MLYTTYFAPPWTVVQCPPYGCSGGEQVILWAYNFPVGGPLTVTLYNQAESSWKFDKYYVCNVVNGATQYPCAEATLIGGDCNAALPSGGSCQAIVNVSVTGLVAGSVYKFIPVATDGVAFYYGVMYGSSQGGANSPPAGTPDILMTAYNFPVGGPLTVTIQNTGAVPVNLTGATYWLESYDYPVPLSGGNCSAAVMPGASCQAIINVSAALNVPGMELVPGTKYKFSVELPSESFSEAFGFGVTYGTSWQQNPP